MIRKILVGAAVLLIGAPADAGNVQSIMAKYIAWRGGPAFERMQVCA